MRRLILFLSFAVSALRLNMILNANKDLRDGSNCVLTYDEAEGWLRAIWSGYVDEDEALRGAESYLEHAAAVLCAYLLNDNTTL